ncbi:MAG: aspartate aminotransferase family protein [Nitrospinota bacterium]|nr:MAG: aspartate aminotransferase family protein [Nitrospinota bacterium]
MQRSAIFARDLYRDYPVITRGEGVYIYDQQGKRYLDASGGSNASVPIGHGVPEVIEAMVAQAQKITFVPMHYFLSEPVQQFAEAVAAITPPGLNKVWFVSGGSEATENAIKLARQYHLERGEGSRYKIISRWQSFHGNTLGALAASGHTYRRSKYLPMLKDFPHIPPANPYRCWFGKECPRCNLECAHILEAVIRQEGPESIAAFMAEPIVGATTGATVPPDGYFAVIREICDRYGVLLIADEVQTGFGRTGKYFCLEHWNVIPDIITVAKGMSGGYTPLGAVIASEKVLEPFLQNRTNFVGGHTYSGNPLSCAVGMAVLQYIQQHKLVEKAAVQGAYLLASLRERLADAPSVGEVRGRGLMVGIEFVRNRETKDPYPPEARFSARVTAEAADRGAIVYPGTGTADGLQGDHILLTPPYIISREEIDELVGILVEAIATTEAAYPPQG